MTGGQDRMFCAGANIRMLAQSSHAWKVNFCKFTNETRNGIEDATTSSGQTWIAALNGTAAGGGYELALACDEIVLIDDGSSAVSLPEVPLLGVLPGTGGLTRVVDKRQVRKDRADLFATKSEGYRGAHGGASGGSSTRPSPRHGWDEEIARRAACGRRDRLVAPRDHRHHADPARPHRDADTAITYPYVTAALDRDARRVDITVAGPERRAAGGRGGRAGPGRRLLAARRHPRARRPRPAAAHQRAASSAPGCSAPLVTSTAVLAYDAPARATWRTTGSWTRSAHYLQAHAQAARRDQPQPVRRDRAGQLLRRLLLELALACDRQYMLDGVYEDVDPDADPAAVVRHRRATTAASRWATSCPGCSPGSGATTTTWTRPARRLGERARRRGAADAPGWSRWRSTTSTSRTRCGSCWRSAPRSRPTR